MRIHWYALFAFSPFSKENLTNSKSLRQGLPRNDAPPTIPRMQRGLPQKRKIPGCKRVVVVSSGKGGVGKSSIAGKFLCFSCFVECGGMINIYKIIIILLLFLFIYF